MAGHLKKVFNRKSHVNIYAGLYWNWTFNAQQYIICLIKLKIHISLKFDFNRYFSKVPLQSAIFRVHISNLLIWPISPYEIQLNTDIIPISSLVSLILPILSPRWRWCRPILLIEYPYSRLPIKSFWLSKTSSDDYVSTIIDHSIFLICTIYSIN